MRKHEALKIRQVCRAEKSCWCESKSAMCSEQCNVLRQDERFLAKASFSGTDAVAGPAHGFLGLKGLFAGQMEMLSQGDSVTGQNAAFAVFVHLHSGSHTSVVVTIAPSLSFNEFIFHANSPWSKSQIEKKILLLAKSKAWRTLVSISRLNFSFQMKRFPPAVDYVQESWMPDMAAVWCPLVHRGERRGLLIFVKVN